MRKTALAALLSLPTVAFASGIEVINVNPRDLALSSSTVAAQQDAAATFANPAALSKLDGLNLSLAGSILDLSTEWDAPEGHPALSGSSETAFAPTAPYALYAAYGTRVAGRGLGIGFGSGVPGGGQVDWDDDWQGRGRIIIVQRRLFGFYLNAGYEVLPWLRLGGGAIYYYGNQYFKQGVQPFPDAYAELKTTGGGFSYQLAAEVKALENLTFGIDYKHKATVSMDGDAHFVVPPELQSPTTQDQGVEQDLPFPNLLAVAVAWRVTKPVLLTLQYNYSRWQVYEEDRFIGDTGFTVIVPRDYDDGHVIRGGVEWDATDRLVVRGGLMRDFSGVKRSTLSPTIPDSDTTGVSAGVGYTFRPGLALNGALFYGNRDKISSEGSEAFPGSYKTDVWIASVGVVWATGVGARAPAVQ